VPFDQEAELDTRLSGIALTAIHARWESHFQGRELMATMKESSQNPDDAKVAPRVDKRSRQRSRSRDVGRRRHLRGVATRSRPTPATTSCSSNVLAPPRQLEGRCAPAVKMIDVEGTAPSWTDVVALFSRALALDHDGGDGDSFPGEWYDELLSRYETRLGKDKPKKKAAPRKAAPVIKEPPPNAVIFVDYSPKSTFTRSDQWVRHPKFGGVGIVIRIGPARDPRVRGERKILAHVAQIAAPIVPKMRPTSRSETRPSSREPPASTSRSPARFDEET